MKQERLWTRDFTLAVVTGFFAAMVVSVLMTTMAVYSMGRFGVGEGLAGFTSSIAMIGSIIGRFFTGRHFDRIGRRRLAMTAGFLNAVVCLFYFIPTGIGPLLAIRLVHGVMSGCVHNAMSTAVIDFIPPARRAEGIAVYTLNFTLALAAGPALGMYIADRWSYNALFAANLCFAVVSIAVLAFIRFAPSVTGEGKTAQAGGAKAAGGVFERSALPLSFAIAPLCMCYASVSAFIEAYTGQLGIVWAASAFFIIYGLFIIVTRPLAGRLIDRRGENHVMIPTMLINTGGIVALGLAGVLPGGVAPALVVVAAAFLMAGGFGAILPMGQAIAVKRAEPHRFSQITATYWVFSDGGMGVGAFALGLIASKAGFTGMFFFETAVALGALAVYWLLHGRHNR
ncbi:MAG: MFS transporter [Clostridiales bacterium]|nr:MFS transporter [Clostridiales bacterium]